MSYPPAPPPGQPYGYQQPGPPMMPAPTHGKATTSLILGLVSLVACGLVLGIPAMIVAQQAKREIRASQGQLGGEGVATAGFVTGLIGTIWSVLGGLLLVGLFVLGTAVEGQFEDTCTTITPEGSFSSEC